MSDQEIMERLQSIRGHVGFFYQNLVTEESLLYNEDSLFIAASIIKLPIAVVMEKYFQSGRVDPLEEVVIYEHEKVGGCGALSLIPGEVIVNYRGLVDIMIAISDNTATNKLLSMFSLENFRLEFEELGLHKTRVNRMLFDKAAKERGVENYFTLFEVMGLLGRMYKGNAVNSGVSQAVLNTLRKQQINHKISCRIPAGVEIAHKTGEDENISHDVAVVYAKKPFLVGFACNDVDVYFAEDAMKNISLALYLRNC